MMIDDEYVDLSDTVISVSNVRGYWRVLWNGKTVRTFIGQDAAVKAMGYAMALFEGRLR